MSRAHGDGYCHPRGARRILRALIPVVCPPEVEDLGLEEAILAHVELSMRAVPGAARAALLAGLYAYDTGAVLRHGRRSWGLSHDRARRYFATWYQGPGLMSQFAKGAKGLLCLAYYEMPQVQESLGYQPDVWIDEVKRRRLATYGDEIHRHAERLYEPEPLVDSMRNAARLRAQDREEA